MMKISYSSSHRFSERKSESHRESQNRCVGIVWYEVTEELEECDSKSLKEEGKKKEGGKKEKKKEGGKKKA